jgi:hypothetical protein
MKPAGRKINYSPQSNAKVCDAWSYSSTLKYVLNVQRQPKLSLSDLNVCRVDTASDVKDAEGSGSVIRENTIVTFAMKD